MARKKTAAISGGTVVALAGLAAAGWYAHSRKKGSKKPTPGSSSDAPLDCGLYRWKPADVDKALDRAVASGERNVEALALLAAREVYPMTPEGEPQQWPPLESDWRATCILDKIRARVDERLALSPGDDEPGADGPSTTPPVEPEAPGRLPPQPKPTPPPRQPPTTPPAPPPIAPPPFYPDEPEPPHVPDEPEPPHVPDEPDPSEDPVVVAGPVDLSQWTDPGNYPTPGMFHQVGGPNSGTSLRVIARKALTTAFFLVFDDLELAQELAAQPSNWEAYRTLIECSPWNHALYGAAAQPGSSGYYETPHGDQISMFPVHSRVSEQLLQGEAPSRRVDSDDQHLPPGGAHAFLWLPFPDGDALEEGRVELSRHLWPGGDPMIVPPPEVMALELGGLPDGKTWGCLGYEMEAY